MIRNWRAHPSLQRITTEWSGAPRLRVATAVAAAILALYALLVLVDWRRSLHDEYQQASLRLYKTAALEGQNVWLARAQQARDLRKALEAQVPSAKTLGLAQAEAQGWVQQLLRAFGRDLTSQTRAAVQVDPAAGIWKVPISVRGAVTAGQYVEMLRRIEGNNRLMVIEQVSIANQGRPSIEMTITAYYRVPPSATATATASGVANAAP